MQQTIFVLLYVIRNAKLVAYVVKRYAIRNAKIRSYAVRSQNKAVFSTQGVGGFTFIICERHTS